MTIGSLMTSIEIERQQNDALHAQRMAAVDQLHDATAVYTAAHIVDALLAKLDWPRGNRRLVDPSAGDGIFLGRALEKLLAGAHVPDEHITNTIEGWELHPQACEQSRARVSAILVNSGRTQAIAAEMAKSMVRNADFLTQGPNEPRYHVIAANPPYLRWVRVPAILRTEYERCVPGYADADMLHAFLDRCSRTLKAEGEIGMITADRWLFNTGAAALRASLGEQQLTISDIERLDVTTAFYRGKNRRSGTPPRVHPLSLVMRKGSTIGQTLTKAPIYPGVDVERYRGFPVLGEIADVRIAPWLGTAGVFVVSADVAATLPAEYLVPAVDTDDIVNGILGKPRRFAIRTSPKVRPCEAILTHLAAHRHVLAQRARVAIPWMPPERCDTLDLSQPSLLVPRIATSPRGVYMPQGILPLNHNLSIVCAEGGLLAKIERALRSDLAKAWVRDHAPRLEGGYYSLTTTLLRQMPISFDENLPKAAAQSDSMEI